VDQDSPPDSHLHLDSASPLQTSNNQSLTLAPDSRIALERNDTSSPTDANPNSALLPGIERPLPLPSAVNLPPRASQCSTTTASSTGSFQVQDYSSLNRSDLDELLDHPHLLSSIQRRFLKLVDDLKGHSKLRWKDSIIKAINKHAK
jgi:hypothetical protein